MSDVLVKVDNVSKRFCRSLKRSLWYGMKDLGSEISGRRHGGGSGLPQSSADIQLRQDEFWAVKDVSFELRRGECLGLIGRNGAGKTTLLRVLNGLIKPDTGRIEMKGKVGAIIALGAGFNPVLSGRENIKITASLAGYSSRKMKEMIDEIIDFAEISDFIDAPVQSYSSGMQVRLGFAAASTFNPDILILDEVLAVGDIGFRAKCYNRIYQIKNDAAVIFVSHSMPHIDRLCTSGIVLRGGCAPHYGDTISAIETYNNQFDDADAKKQKPKTQGLPRLRLNINGEEGPKEVILNKNQNLEIKYELQTTEEQCQLEIALGVNTVSGDLIAQSNNVRQGIPISTSFFKCKGSIIVKNLRLGDGKLNLSLIIRNAQTNEILFWEPKLSSLVVRNEVYHPAPFILDADYFQSLI